jgi:leucyl/phenylalanyl-tRNA--protein transferase
MFDAEALIAAYRRGVFPMAEGRDDAAFYLVDPERRGVIPLDAFHVPRRLARVVKSDRFSVSLNTDFAAVLDACAAPAPGREETWISGPIRSLYLDLHRRGLAYSVECRRDGRLVGGLYGVALGGAVFGESMFSRPEMGGTDASKTALVHLVARMIAGGFTLLDTQFLTDHLARFGAVEIARSAYRARLKAALATEGDLYALGEGPTGAEVLQVISHRS